MFCTHAAWRFESWLLHLLPVWPWPQFPNSSDEDHSSIYLISLLYRVNKTTYIKCLAHSKYLIHAICCYYLPHPNLFILYLHSITFTQILKPEDWVWSWTAHFTSHQTPPPSQPITNACKSYFFNISTVIATQNVVGLQTSSINIKWEFVRNAASQALLHTYWIMISILTRSRWFIGILNFEKLCFKCIYFIPTAILLLKACCFNCLS